MENNEKNTVNEMLYLQNINKNITELKMHIETIERETKTLGTYAMIMTIVVIVCALSAFGMAILFALK